MSHVVDIAFKLIYSFSIASCLTYCGMKALAEYRSFSRRKVVFTKEESEISQELVDSLLNTLGIKRESELEDELG